MKYVRDIPFKEFVDSHHKAVDEDLAELRRTNEDADVPLIFTETEEILGLLTGLTHPSRILEIGTAHGYSSLFFAKKLPDAHITTIERNPVMVEAAKAEFASRKEGERIDFRVGDASEILNELVSELSDADETEKFDFVFIDAAKSHYREFFEAAEKICTKDALIACDNILLKGWIVEAEGRDAKRHRTSIKYMKQFLEYLRQRDDLEVSILTGADGLAIIRFINEK
ncbi:MAG: O-methyltransferase [Mogibacterium sp.]|nr:O-methyltransferase [Mogibacterium sp.]MBR4089298.1 O-methyltransferase [Mogibacterium sp.]